MSKMTETPTERIRSELEKAEAKKVVKRIPHLKRVPKSLRVKLEVSLSDYTSLIYHPEKVVGWGEFMEFRETRHMRTGRTYFILLDDNTIIPLYPKLRELFELGDV